MLVLAESLVTLSPVIIWKMENIPNELSDLAEESSVQNIKGISWLHLSACLKNVIKEGYTKE